MGSLLRAAALRVRPRSDSARDEQGRCSVCGVVTRFRFNSWAVSDEIKRKFESVGAADAFVRRETLACDVCGSSLRVRRLADVLLLHYADRAHSLRDLLDEPEFRALEIAEINSIGRAHHVLARHPRLRYSEYQGKRRLRHAPPTEDICALSYDDASLDIVLTSETLEHVPDFELALVETSRVLRSGGRHVFTVPLLPGGATTRRVRRVDGNLVHVAPPEYHGRSSRPLVGRLSPKLPDLLCYTDFGLDIVDDLRAAGFEPELHFYSPERWEQDLAIVICAQRV
jgi:SAM-dependent methyltransferase